MINDLQETLERIAALTLSHDRTFEAIRSLANAALARSARKEAKGQRTDEQVGSDGLNQQASPLPLPESLVKRLEAVERRMAALEQRQVDFEGTTEQYEEDTDERISDLVKSLRGTMSNHHGV